MKKASILEVRAYVVAPGETGADYHNQSDKHWIIDLPIANPMSIYEEYRAKRTSWGINALGTVIVEVELDDGTVGIGCSIGSEPADTTAGRSHCSALWHIIEERTATQRRAYLFKRCSRVWCGIE